MQPRSNRPISRRRSNRLVNFYGHAGPKGPANPPCPLDKTPEIPSFGFPENLCCDGGVDIWCVLEFP